MSDYNNNGNYQNSDNNSSNQQSQNINNNQDHQYEAPNQQNNQNQEYTDYNGNGQNHQNGQNQGYSAPEYNQWNPKQQNYYYQGNVPPQPPVYNAPPMGYQQKSRIAAGILGILFGVFGIHNFYINKANRAVAQLLLTILGGVLTCGVASIACWIWSLVEGISILIGNDSWAYDGNGVIMKD